MSITHLLQEIKPQWIDKVSYRLARGEGVRASFLEELNRLYELLEHAVETGDPAWLDSLLVEWVDAQTKTGLDTELTSLTPILSQIMLLTFETSLELPLQDQTLQVLNALLPLFTYAFERTIDLEIDNRVNQIAGELKEAQDELELIDRSKSKFISVAAHELKTPLTLIEGYAAMLRDLYPRDDQTSQPVILLKGVDNGTQRLREIVDDMIDVSLIDNKLLSLNFQPIWLTQLFKIIEQELAEVVKQRNLDFSISQFPGCDELTFGDPERLYQAFRNLVSNAIKFTPDGGKIRLDGRTLPGFIEVTVTDTGIGIHPKDQLRIFDKFGQLSGVERHSSGKTKFKGGGPGLGLSITKGIIEAHGGTIWVESEGYDEDTCPGSTFHVLLPVYKKPPDHKSSKLFDTLLDSHASENQVTDLKEIRQG